MVPYPADDVGLFCGFVRDFSYLFWKYRIVEVFDK